MHAKFLQWRNIVSVDVQQFCAETCLHNTDLARCTSHVFSMIACVKRAVLGFGALVFEKKLEIGSIEKLQKDLLILSDETVEWQIQAMEM